MLIHRVSHAPNTTPKNGGDMTNTSRGQVMLLEDPRSGDRDESTLSNELLLNSARDPEQITKFAGTDMDLIMV